MSTVNLNIDALKGAFPWGTLKGTVVDVGGGSGKVSITLAQVINQPSQNRTQAFIEISTNHEP
jgi:hypothetical protein